MFLKDHYSHFRLTLNTIAYLISLLLYRTREDIILRKRFPIRKKKKFQKTEITHNEKKKKKEREEFHRYSRHHGGEKRQKWKAQQAGNKGNISTINTEMRGRGKKWKKKKKERKKNGEGLSQMVKKEKFEFSIVGVKWAEASHPWRSWSNDHSWVNHSAYIRTQQTRK